jgi:hypothetical protein
MSEALAAWNGYVFDRPRSPRWEGVYPGPEMALRRLLWARLLSQVDKRPSNLAAYPALHQGTAPGDQHHERQDCQTTPQESPQRDAVQAARWFDIGSARHRRHPHHATRRRPRSFRPTPYLDPHERATENASPRTERGTPNPGVRTRARRWSGESGGSEGLASATTDNRPMSIESIAHQPRVPQPPSPRGNRR